MHVRTCCPVILFKALAGQWISENVDDDRGSKDQQDNQAGCDSIAAGSWHRSGRIGTERFSAATERWNLAVYPQLVTRESLKLISSYIVEVVKTAANVLAYGPQRLCASIWTGVGGIGQIASRLQICKSGTVKPHGIRVWEFSIEATECSMRCTTRLLFIGLSRRTISQQIAVYCTSTAVVHAYPV